MSSFKPHFWKKMKNILFNLQLLHLKFFSKMRRNIVFCPLTKNSTNSLLGNQEKKSLGLLSLRPMCAAVENSEKLNQISVSKATKHENTIIYSGSLTHRVKGVKIFTCLSSVGGLFIQPWMLQNILQQQRNNMVLGVALLSCVGFFTFVTPLLIHLLTKKYVTEIWYNSTNDTYTATILSFFLRKINISFKIGDVRVPSTQSVFTTMYIKERPVFIISDSFLEMDHYVKMMGYNKPTDLNLSKITDVLSKHQTKKN